MTSEDRDVEWYVQNRGLATGGIDVTTLTDDDIPIAEIEALFDKKSSKNGYRYDRKPEREVVASILELYRRVTGKNKVMNSELNVCFARGVVAWLKGQVLDWAKYAVYCNKYATALRITKSTNRELKGQATHKGEPSAAKCGRRPPLVGKQPNKENIGSSHVKAEGRAAKVSFMPLKGNKSGCPNWKEEEISEVGELLNALKKVLIGARQDVLTSQEQHADAAAASQVCNMRLEGRQKVYLDSQSHKLEMVKELNDLVRKHEHQGEGAQEIGIETKVEDQALGLARIISVFGAQQLPLEICDVQQRLEWAKNNDKVALSMLNTGQQECEKANKKVATSLATLNAKQQRVLDLGSQILCVAQQWEKMKEGTGSCFYPQPVVRSHEDLCGEDRVLTINNCPICGHGFEVNDILVGSCGHTYHPICMNWHTKTSLCCKVAHCQRQFHPDWLLSVGVRPSIPQSNVQDYQRQRNLSMQKLTKACPKVETMQAGLQVFSEHLLEKNPDNDFAMMALDGPKVEGWTNWDTQPISDSFLLGTGMTDAPNISSSVGSKYDSSIQGASPATFSVTKSNESCFVASASGITTNCLICQIKRPDIKFQGCGHSKYCYDCFTQAIPTCCPICSTIVDGWSKMPVSEVTSPLRHNMQARGVTVEGVVVTPPISLKLNLSSAFDSLVVPQLEATKSKLIANENRKPIGVEILGQKETLLDEHSDGSDSDDNERGLVHYPPRPVFHREAKQDVPISFTSDESESDGEDYAQQHVALAARTCLPSKDGRASIAANTSAAINTIVKVEKEGSTSDVSSIKVENGIRHKSQVPCPNLNKPRRNPLQPNPDCEKRKTRGEATQVGVEKAKKKRKKNKSVSVKNFNSFSY